MHNRSILSLFKIGIGPSSSHTLGPMLIGYAFNCLINSKDAINKVKGIKIDLYGSLSWTGRGHLTDIAIVLGLGGYNPEHITTAQIEETIQKVKKEKKLWISKDKVIPFDWDKDIIFHKRFLKEHENGVTLSACISGGKSISETYFSIGGGFIKTKEQFKKGKISDSCDIIAYDFPNARRLLELCEEEKISIAEVVRRREEALASQDFIDEHITSVWEVMTCCIRNGVSTKGVLPGKLQLRRRAGVLYDKLLLEKEKKDKNLDSFDFLSAYAMAVGEENASGHRVVTAPTNGACAVIPAVMYYFDQFVHPLTFKEISNFVLTACAIGHIFKTNASISGAEAGCQAEIGVASSMAAAGYASLLGETNRQILTAAETAMEHHLGLTCDPVGGLVQIPCIERNAFGASKAIFAAKMSLNRDWDCRVSLDEIVKVMFETGKDLNRKYRETSKGGLASVIQCR